MIQKKGGGSEVHKERGRTHAGEKSGQGPCWREEWIVSFSTVSKKESLETDSENQAVALRRLASSSHTQLSPQLKGTDSKEKLVLFHLNRARNEARRGGSRL